MIGQTQPAIQNLPPEILEEIFINCLPLHTTFAAREAPLVLCSICSSWRSVALHSPRLWSRISINVSDLISSTSKGTTASSFRDFLGRSGNIPLSIQLSATFPEPLDHPEWKHHLHQLINQNHGRIHNLELSSSWLNHFLRSLPSDPSFPQLASVTVTSFNGPSFDSLPTPFLSFSHADLLRRVVYNAYISHETALNLGFRWEQLTHLTLADVDYISWTHIFHRCSNLHSGTFVISGTAQPLPKSITHVDFPSLKYLSLHNAQSCPRSPLSLRGYAFPNLDELHLAWNYSPGFDSGFLSTIRNLRKLTISNPPYHTINTDEIITILSSTPAISELRLSSDHCSSEIFEALTYHPHQQSPLTPQLRTLAIDTSLWSSMYDQTLVLGALKKAVGSRWWVYPSSKVRRLACLEIAIPVSEMDNTEELMKQYTSAGLLLTLRAPPVVADRHGEKT